MFKYLRLKLHIYLDFHRKSSVNKDWDKVLSKALDILEGKQDEELWKYCAMGNYTLKVGRTDILKVWIANKYYSYGHDVNEEFKGMPRRRTQVRLAKLEKRIRNNVEAYGVRLKQSKLHAKLEALDVLKD